MSPGHSHNGEEGMRLELSPAQAKARRTFQRFVADYITPEAAAWDRQGSLPLEVIHTLRQHGYLGAPLPSDLGGGGMDAITYGLLTEALGTGCSSVRSLLTVHDMATLAIKRWGSPRLREELVPRLAKAEVLAALALSEPNVGSDAAGIETSARFLGGEYILTGHKKWITYGEIADFFLVLARCEDKPTAFVLPADTPGLSRHPLRVAGTRASRLAELQFNDCRVPAAYRVGKVGVGLSVITTALDHGRYSVAWGAVGIAQACLDASLDYTSKRRQFGKELREHQLVQRLLTEMIVNTRAARLLCYRAGHLRQARDPGALPETMIAKYFASRTATRAAADAIQLHGANGLSEDFPLERFERDARVTEIIEGSTQIQQTLIPLYPLAEL
jgi:alkylation response protein AidB-like acyl-CoA dehydrogenase